AGLSAPPGGVGRPTSPAERGDDARPVSTRPIGESACDRPPCPAPAPLADPDALVLLGDRGAYLRRSNFHPRVWLPATRRARVSGLRFHDLRHTAAGDTGRWKRVRPRVCQDPVPARHHSQSRHPQQLRLALLVRLLLLVVVAVPA